MTTTINASTSSGLIVTSDTSGTLALQSNGSTIASVGTSGMTINSYVAGTSMLTQGTAQATTSGTSIDFTGIPSWVKRITVMFNGVSLSGTSSFLIQLGTSGTPTTSGYTSTSSYTTTPNATGSAGGIYLTSGFAIQGGNAAYTLYGNTSITNVSGNVWVSQGNFANILSVPLIVASSGGITLGGVLNMVRITTVNGTDTFDAGSINILYE